MEPSVDVADQVYAELITPIEGRMTRTIAGILNDPDDAADALQNAMLYVWKNLRKIHRHPNPQGYILRVCISASYDVLRRNVRQKQLEVHNLPDQAPSHHDAVSPESTPHTLSAIRSGIATLPKKQAQAVLLRLMEDEPFNVIGRILGCSEATARSHVSKGLARLRQHLSNLGLRPVEG